MAKRTESTNEAACSPINEHTTVKPLQQPNTSRPRRNQLNLERNDITPSRSNCISRIFNSAAIALQSPQLQSRDMLTSSTKEPESQAALVGRSALHNTTVSGSMAWAKGSSPESEEQPLPCSPTLPRQGRECRYDSPRDFQRPITPCREPVSSGYNSSSSSSQRISGVDLKNYDQTLDDDTDYEDVHSTHGVPMFFPIEKAGVDRQQAQASVDTWLDQIPYPEFGKHGLRAERSMTLSSASASIRRTDPKNKENIPPSASGYVQPAALYPRKESHYLESPPRVICPETSFQPLSERALILPRCRPKNSDLPHSTSADSAALNTRRPGTPRGPFNIPHNHRTSHIAQASEEFTRGAEPTRMATIRDEEAKDAELVELSPSVSRYRRGRGPKVERSASYYDQDILPREFASRGQ